jgi:hypothetical protein
MFFHSHKHLLTKAEYYKAQMGQLTAGEYEEMIKPVPDVTGSSATAEVWIPVAAVILAAAMAISLIRYTFSRYPIAQKVNQDAADGNER